MRILLATDAWAPQVNGVVMTLRNTIRGLENIGHLVEVIGPDRFRSVPCPTYPEIRLALRPYPRFAELARRFAPDVVHIATEGPVGLAARKFCLREQLALVEGSSEADRRDDDFCNGPCDVHVVPFY